MLEVKLLPKQQEVFFTQAGSDYDIRLYQGGVGSGKTFIGALKGLQVCHDKPGCTWLVVSDTAARLKISTIETYQSLLGDSGIKYTYNKTDNIIRLPQWGNSRVLFKGLDDPQALRSVNGIGCHIEEASLLKEASFLAVLERLRQNNPGQPIDVILTTNPQTTRGWLYEYFVTNGGQQVVSGRNADITFNRRRVIARTIDNPYVSDAFIAGMQASYDEELYRIMVLGEDGDYNAGLVCKTWASANVDDSVVYRPDQRLYLTCDFNVDPMCWAVAHRFNGEYHYFDELCVENTTTVLCADEFYRRYGQHSAGIIVTGDVSGDNRSTATQDALTTNYTIIRNRLSSLGMSNVALDLRSSNPSIDGRVAAWNAMVCNQEGVRRVRVNPRCKWLVWNAENLSYYPGTKIIEQPSKNTLKNEKKAKFIGHMFDAASYLVERYDPIMLDAAAHGRKMLMASQPFRPSRAI